MSAPVKTLHVQRGARVRAGQILMELEARDLAGAAAESRASLDLAEATFETTAKATVPQELQKAELDARAAKEAFDAAQAVFDNRQRLYREGAIAQKDVNDAQVHPQPGPRPVRNLAKTLRGPAEFCPRSGNQGGRRAA